MHREFSRLVGAVLLVYTIVMASLVRAGEPAPGFESMPKIDIHVHLFADYPKFAAMLERIDFRIVNICGGGIKPEVMAERWRTGKARSAAYPGLYYLCPTFDLTRRDEPGYGEAINKSLYKPLPRAR